MPNLIVRMYDTKQHARDAVTKLQEGGFRADAIIELSPGSAKSIAGAIKAGRLMGHRADFYAERVAQGRSLVAVDAPFGQGQRATQILDSCAPVDQELELPAEPVSADWNEATPLSSALGMPVLTRNNPSPLSDALGLKMVSRSKFYLISELASPNTTLSSIFGWRLLSRNPAPLSSMLGLPLLSRWAKSTSLGMKLLSDKAAPLSSAFGIPTLSRNPTPLSSALGWTVLSRPS